MNLSDDIPNPLTNGKILSFNTDNSIYCLNLERGNRDFVMTRSDLCEFYRCPHRWRNGYKDDDTRSTEWGSLIDCLALQPDSFRDSWAVCPETYPDSKTGEHKPWNWNANFCKEWRTKLDGKQEVKHDTYQQAVNATKFLFGDEQIKRLIHCSKKQVMVTAQYKDHDTKITVPIKTLIDLVPDVDSPFGKCLADLKTCNSGLPGVWKRAVFDHGYHVQAAMYLDAYVAATGEDRCEFRHILQESFPPWQVGKRILSLEFMNIGRMAYIEALKEYCRCLVTNYWPAYENEFRGTVLDGWLITEPDAWMVTL